MSASFHSHACQKPAVVIELSLRDPRQLALAFHEIAHADARPLAKQNRQRIGLVVGEPAQSAISYR
jgi:hypothetical protein